MEAGLNASLELQRRETMGIRTKHFGASFEAGLEAGLEGLKAMEIGENNVTKKVPVLVLKTYEKAGAQKWASPQGRPQLRVQKSYQFQVLKTNPKEASFPCLSS